MEMERAGLLDWFRKLVDLVGEGSLMDLVAVLKALVGLGTPPPIDDEQGLRKWIGELGIVLSDAADKTGTRADDVVVEFCLRVVNNDNAWEVCYAVIKLISVGSRVDSAHANRLVFAMGTEAPAGVDPLTVLTIVKMIMDIIKLFKDRKD